MPNIFPGYPDTVVEFALKDKLVDIKYMLNDKELNSYISIEKDSDNEELYIYPITMATEVMVLNDTAWKPFADQYNLNYDDLSTWEGIARVGEKFYEYSDGKAFFGRDAMANYMFVGSKQLGTEIVSGENGNAKITLNKKVLKKLWDNYYVPYVNGYYASIGKFRSDDAKTEDIIAFVGSSGGSAYFPEDIVKDDGTTYKSDLKILPLPNFYGKEKMAVIQGAGMAISKISDEEDEASLDFMKWITEPAQNWKLSIASGYLPVNKESFRQEYVNKTAKYEEEKPYGTQFKTIEVCIDTINNYEPYIGNNYKNEYEYRAIINKSLESVAKADRNEEFQLTEKESNRRFNYWITNLSKELSDVEKK